MTISYLKKASKTPQTGTDETQKIVADMLATIEAGGEEAALEYGRKLDGYSGNAVVSAEQIACRRRCCVSTVER
jgi:sulfopropanediol 3-dehydrogenase